MPSRIKQSGSKSRSSMYNGAREDIRKAKEKMAASQGRSFLRNLRPLCEELTALAVKLGKI